MIYSFILLYTEGLPEETSGSEKITKTMLGE